MGSSGKLFIAVPLPLVGLGRGIDPGALELHGLAAKQGDRLAMLVVDAYVIDAIAAGEALLDCRRGEHVAQLNLRDEVDHAVDRHGGLVVAVAGESESRVGQAESHAPVSDVMAV